MLSFLTTHTVKIQRRAANPIRNTLNEPDYGAESTWTVAYASVPCRMDTHPRNPEYNETGERVDVGNEQFIYVEPEYILYPQDRVTILESSDPSEIGAFYIVNSVYNEYDSQNNVHHRVGQLQVH